MLMNNFLRFPGFHLRACTLSYDDGRNYDARLIEIMRKYGLRGTFNLNSNHFASNAQTCMSIEDIKELYAEDTEIALHGYNHLSLANVTPNLALRDIITDKEYMEKAFGKIIRGMAYANGSFSDDVVELLRSAGVVYSRTTRATQAFEIPDEWLLWHPTCHHKHERLFELIDEFFEEPRAYFWAQSPRIFYLWGHSYEFDKDDNWERIDKFGAEMAKHDNVWHATNMQIYDYIEAFKRLVFSSDMSMVHNPTATDIYMNVMYNNILVRPGETVKTGVK